MKGETLIIGQEDVARLLPMAECIELMAGAFRALANDDAVLPLRSKMWLPDRSGVLGLMPGYLGSPRALGIKVISVMPGNHGTPFDSHQGAVLLFEPEHGRLVSILDASAITAIRTAAASGLATRLLAREDAGDLALLGSGVQAGTHLEAMRAVRTLRRLRVWSQHPERAREFAERASRTWGRTAEAMSSAREAVEGADLVCTATSAREPVLEGAWLAEGAHVNAVGSSVSTSRELDSQAVARGRLFVDRRESAVNESGDYLIPLAEGAISPDHIRGELADLVTGRVEGRRRPDEITIFKSLGLAIEDLAAAHHVHRKALAAGAGTAVDLGGLRLAYH